MSSTTTPLPVRSQRDIQIGAVFPQTDMTGSADEVRTYGTGVEALGLRHILAYDHVVGGDLAAHPKLRGRYTSQSAFHEVLVLFGYLAAITHSVRLVTGVLILPQRQTALVAKQAAEVDRLSDGRLTLGIGVGWNDLEYVALNEDFTNRGRRSEEQIAVLRRLWTEDVVDFTGRWHRLAHVGILPRPEQRPIPVWIGANGEAGVRRAARIADGFFANGSLNAQMDELLVTLRRELDTNGRAPGSFGLDARITVGTGIADDWKRQFAAWQERGATHISLVTHGAGLPDMLAHLGALEAALRAFDGM